MFLFLFACWMLFSFLDGIKQTLFLTRSYQKHKCFIFSVFDVFFQTYRIPKNRFYPCNNFENNALFLSLYICNWVLCSLFNNYNANVLKSFDYTMLLPIISILSIFFSKKKFKKAALMIMWCIWFRGLLLLITTFNCTCVPVVSVPMLLCFSLQSPP